VLKKLAQYAGGTTPDIDGALGIASGAGELSGNAALLAAARFGSDRQFADFVETWADTGNEYARFVEADGLRMILDQPNADALLNHLHSPVSFADEGFEAVSGTPGVLDADVIRFSQSSISQELRDGTNLFDRILEAQTAGAYPPSLDPLELFEFRGQVFSLDNRRLFIA